MLTIGVVGGHHTTATRGPEHIGPARPTSDDGVPSTRWGHYSPTCLPQQHK